ncbi:methyl-accepting chemotaxis protein [Rhizobium helianthi]|uniref:Methyl-accepting chemotaxis protein n=1 Tax=Rhizobium helianthi TaxID=1132695 RepID=A0ABW4M5G0_9HYPH
MSFRDLSINKKIITTFLALMSVCLCASAVVYWQGLRSSDASEGLVVAQNIVAAVSTATEAQLEQAISHRDFIATGSSEHSAAIQAKRSAVVAALDQAQKLAKGKSAILASLEQLRAAADNFNAAIAKAQGQGATAAIPLGEFRQAAAKVRADAEALAKSMVALQSNAHSALLWTLMIGGAVAGVISVGLIWALSRAIVAPIVGMTDAMTELANGNHRIDVPALDRGDEVGQMAKAVAVFKDAAIEKLRLSSETEEMRQTSDRERQENDARKARETAEIEFAMNSLADGLSKLAAGDVAYRLERPFADHLDRLRVDFNQALGRLQDALESVGRNASAINAGAAEIRAATDDLAKRTERQAASVEQTAAAVEEVTTTIKDSAKRAEDVGQRVERARVGAERSGEVVRRAVSAMEGISKSSSEIVNIISVIDDIAFQTNLLALNAGVEAARAGEAGKGFAVVAQEVRELAQRSANAAREIKTLLTTSSQQVDAGVALVGETGDALQAIVVEVQEINENIKAIVTSTREQSLGLQEINQAISAMDHNTQQNAAMVEEQTAASHSLAREASALDELLGQFKLGTMSAKPHSAPVASASSTASAAARPMPAAQPAAKPAAQPAAKAAPRAVAGRGPVAATATSRPAASPATALHSTLAKAFGAASPAAQPTQDNWEEF